MCTIPSTARVMNQTTMIGPKKVASRAVPLAWMTKNATSSTNETIVISLALTIPCSAGTSFMPWKAPSTDMAGVMMASP